jgi:hypothetical protein
VIVAFLSQLWVQRLGWTLVHFLWQGTVVAILYAALRGLLGRSLSAQGRYVLACLSLVAMTVAPLLTFLLIPKSGGSAVPAVSWDISAAGSQQLLSSVVAAWLLGVVAFSVRLFGGWRFTARLRSVSHPAPAEWQQTLERTAASGDVLTYARALAKLESQRSPRLRPALAANGGALVNRVRRLIQPSQPITNNLPGPGAAWAMSLLWLVGVGVATIHAAQTPVSRVVNIPPVVRPAQTSPVLNAFLYDPFLPAPQAAAKTPAAGTEEKKTRLEGRVISQSGEAVPRATVYLLGGQRYSQTSDDAGRFVFDDVTPGRYTLQVTRIGFLTGAYGAPWAGALPPAFTLEAGQTLKDMVIRLTPQSVIAGRVTNQDGDPAEGATVGVLKVSYVRGRKSLDLWGKTAQTDDEGSFRIAGLTPGRYYISVQPQPTREAPNAPSPPTTADISTLYPSALDVAGAAPLEVAPGARLDRIDIRLRRWRPPCGRTPASTGAPKSPLPVRISRAWL